MQYSKVDYPKKTIWLIGIAVIVKIALSFLLELGNDEVYYYTYAVQPDWNHFDHPPLVGWMIQLSTLNLNWVSTLSMRLGSMLAAAFSTWFVFRTGTLIHTERAGWIAALLYTCSIYTSIIAGLFIMPDSPQLLFFTWSIYLMSKWVVKPQLFSTMHWIGLGCLIGLATLSKVHGLYLWVGFGGFILFHQIKTLKQPLLYIAVLFTICALIPIVYWNMDNDFITYKFHSKRVMHSGIQFASLVQQIVGEMVYQNPLVYISCLIPLIRLKKLNSIFKNQDSVDQQSSKIVAFLLWISLPLIILFWVISLFNPTLPHWTGPGFIGLFLLSGIYWSEFSTQLLPKLIQWALGFLVVLVFGFIGLVHLFPFQLGSKSQVNLGEYNPINDVTGWTQFSAEFKQLVEQDSKSIMMKDKAPILVSKWFPAGHILFYTARPIQKQVIAMGALEDVHKFAWLNLDQPSLQLGQDAYFIQPSNLPFDPTTLILPYFEKMGKTDSIEIQQRGVVLRKFYVYRLKNCQKIPAPILPRK
jgi:4-amino-4-deoxy-L-arabinose transferase-like glycosyltransferase